MALKDLFNMAKANRYTQDGRDQIAKALENETEDVRYKPGDISQKTGLQKQPDGSWAEPNRGAPKGTKQTAKKEKRPKAISWNKANLPEMRDKEEFITAKQSENFYHQFGLDKTGEHVDAKGWTVKEFKNDDGETYLAKYDGDKFVGSEYNPAGSDKPAEAPKFGKGSGTESDPDKEGSIAWYANQAKKKPASVPASAHGHLESESPQDLTITKEDEERFGKAALSGLSGPRESALPKQTPEEIAEIGRAGREFREGRQRDAKERAAEAQKALAEQIKKEANNPEMKIRGMNKNQYIFNTMMERHIPKEKAEESWNQEVERVNKLRAEATSEPTEQKSADPISVGNTVKFKRTGQPIKIKKIENYGGTPIIVGEYDYNGKTETNRFRMDEISTDSAPRQLTGDCKIRVRKA